MLTRNAIINNNISIKKNSMNKITEERMVIHKKDIAKILTFNGIPFPS